MGKYFKPKSLSWISGLIVVAIPVLRYMGVAIPEGIEGIFMGTGIIGLKGAISGK